MAADFFTIEAWTRVGLQRFVILFFIELCTRKVEIAGIASNVRHKCGTGELVPKISNNLQLSANRPLGSGQLVLNSAKPFTHTAEPLWDLRAWRGEPECSWPVVRRR